MPTVLQHELIPPWKATGAAKHPKLSLDSRHGLPWRFPSCIDKSRVSTGCDNVTEITWRIKEMYVARSKETTLISTQVHVAKG